MFPPVRSLARKVPPRAAEALGSLLDLVFPPLCVGCRVPVPPDTPLCPSCRPFLPLNAPCSCAGCGKASAEGPFNFCPLCRGTLWRDGLLVAGPFRHLLRDLVHLFKYGGDLAAGRFLGNLLAERVLEGLHPPPDLVVPVPLHPRRLRARGFNQASLLSRAVSRASGWPLERRLLKRKNDTLPLAGLSREERRREMRGVVELRRPGELGGGAVLLVDDVVTTGVTAEACCQVLKEAGAARVIVAAVARA